MGEEGEVGDDKGHLSITILKIISILRLKQLYAVTWLSAETNRLCKQNVTMHALRNTDFIQINFANCHNINYI